MRLRTLLLCVTAAALAVPSAAGAEPPKKPKKPSPAACPAGFTDPRGDHALAPVPGTEAYDLLGGNVAFGRREVVAVLRLAAAPADEPRHRTGAWRIAASAGGVRLEFEVRRSATGAMTSSATAGGEAVSHTVDAASATIVWRTKRQGLTVRRPHAFADAVDAATAVGGVGADSASTRRTPKCA